MLGVMSGKMLQRTAKPCLNSSWIGTEPSSIDTVFSQTPFHYMMTPVMVISTYPNRDAAMKVAGDLVKEKAAACVNISEVSSVYSWKGKIENASECIAIFKATGKNRDLLKRRIAETHPYDVPEIAEIDVTSMNRPYLDWLAESAR